MNARKTFEGEMVQGAETVPIGVTVHVLHFEMIDEHVPGPAPKTQLLVGMQLSLDGNDFFPVHIHVGGNPIRTPP